LSLLRRPSRSGRPGSAARSLATTRAADLFRPARALSARRIAKRQQMVLDIELKAISWITADDCPMIAEESGDIAMAAHGHFAGWTVCRAFSPDRARADGELLGLAGVVGISV